MTEKPSKDDAFKSLTWSDIEAWAGKTIVSRGRSYQRSHQVREIACTLEGAIVAWVEGYRQYATVVDIEKDELISNCSCPYGATCKHAVAVVLEYLECLKRHQEIPLVAEQDERLKLLQDGEGAEGIDGIPDPRQCPAKGSSEGLRAFLEQQTKQELISTIKELADRYPAVRQSLKDRHSLSNGKVRRLINTLEKEIDNVSANPGWSNHWNEEGYTPDYSKVRDRLEMLLANGHADEVVKLGKKLLEAGTNQVEMTDDEGETAEEIASCMPAVFRALSKSSLSTVDQMIWAIDADLNDEYDLCQGAGEFWEQEHPVADWNALAERLMERLRGPAPAGKRDEFSRNYHRDQLSDWLISALKEADRGQEIMQLCEREAQVTGSYVRLVDYLLSDNRREEAEHWAREGIEATSERWPGIASNLRTILREMRENDGDTLSVAAFRADDFFARPSMKTYEELRDASAKAGVWTKVREAAMHYLKTGNHPATAQPATGHAWPLPDTGLSAAKVDLRDDFPIAETLIDIAIAEKRPEEIIRWYEHRKQASGRWGLPWHQENEVAQAIADTHPDLAVAIWKRLAEAMIAQTKPKSYETAAQFLRYVHRIQKRRGEDKDWRDYLAELRQANARKRRLLEILDGLDDLPIVGEVS